MCKLWTEVFFVLRKRHFIFNTDFKRILNEIRWQMSRLCQSQSQLRCCWVTPATDSMQMQESSWVPTNLTLKSKTWALVYYSAKPCHLDTLTAILECHHQGVLVPSSSNSNSVRGGGSEPGGLGFFVHPGPHLSSKCGDTPGGASRPGLSPQDRSHSKWEATSMAAAEPLCPMPVFPPWKHLQPFQQHYSSFLKE